jgi:hypothetical protein
MEITTTIVTILVFLTITIMAITTDGIITMVGTITTIGTTTITMVGDLAVQTHTITAVREEAVAVVA